MVMKWHDPWMDGTGFLHLIAGADVGSSLVERWRELGPVLWLAAGGAALAWGLLLVAFAVATQPREVDAAPATLDLGGTEPPAVVNLLTNDWRLGHEALPATLLDLAARRLVAIEQVGPQTFVRLRAPSDRAREGAADLEAYERMVLEHVTHRATDGVVPAEALTTGPEDEARGWWRKFRRSVERDGRARGLSRARWSPVVHTILTVSALAVAAVVAVAATSLPDNPEESDDGPIGAAIGFGLLTAGTLVVAAESLNGQRDTRTGRDAAARWLGLRTQLAEDPLFAEYPPAGVAIWDRLLAYGAAMGTAHGAVRAIPMGAESDREAWSAVGGRWRVVRIGYPRLLPPGYGRHPGVAVLLGLFQLALAALAFPAVRSAAPALLDLARDSSADRTVPAGFRLAVTIALTVVVTVAAVLALRGASMLVVGIADLLSGRRRVEGRVLRVRRRGDKERVRWYVAVDDGSANRVRAWRTPPGGAVQGCTARASVTRWLAHVRDLEVVSAAAVPASVVDEDDPEDASAPLSALLGTVTVGSMPSVAAASVPLPTPSGAPPPLPDAATVSTAAGRPLERDAAARPHPLAVDGASATFSAGDGTSLQVAWVDPSFLQAHRSMPRLLRRTVSGVGDEAYRSVIGGGVVARRGDWVLLVMGGVPGAGNRERNEVFEAVAGVTADLAHGA
jgi:hypothetical protein